ncbi:ATP-binding protein [Priestia aryabhattai]|uniref:ATP-binding protein n=1 Tax=Priestia aryabhattai TaxID=412384 RepID=UPI000BF1A70E|nr:ATP-binding protein [Priestia aryabhattai]PEI60316.1 hypothetical protein CN635_04780 [Priestia aryabhattai]
MSTIDFLRNISNKRLRKEIQNIIGSYTHPYDIVAELCQNIVDAINSYIKKYPSSNKAHRVTLEINALKRSIRVTDTGIGLELDQLAESLAPHGTFKDEDFDSIGEKGVGLTFAVFSSNHAEVTSVSRKGKYKAVIANASAWTNGNIDEIPEAEIKEKGDSKYNPNNFGTTIYLESIKKKYNDNIDIFHISLARLIYIIRTKTALGYLNKLWEKEHPNIIVDLIHTDLNNETTTTQIDFSYQLPSNFLNKNDVINYDEFVQQAATLSDSQKSAKLKGKSLELIGNTSRGGRTIRYYAFYAPTRNLWKTISRQNDLLIHNNLDEEPESEIKGGIFLATKGMPTGVELVPPVTGQSGYWANMYILIEDNNLDFDLGRKFIPSPTQSMYKNIAKELFSKLTAFTKYISTDPSSSQQITTVQQAKKNQHFTKLGHLNDLGVDGINYLKYPDGQEAAVVAIFHELIGAKILRGYYSLKHGYKLTYDFWGKYIINSSQIGTQYNEMGDIDLPIVIEFKHDCHDILDDVESNTKFFIDMDLIVCWDIDAAKFNKKNIQVRPLAKEEVFFYGSNYELNWPGAYNLGSASTKPVLCLRKFIEDYIVNG